MKKTALLLIVSVALLAYAGTAQEIHFGPKVGLNIANVYDSEGEQFDADAKLGFVIGAFVAIPFGSVLGFQPELLFSQKGFRASGSFLGSPYTFTRTLNYLDIPLLLAIKPIPMISILAGPQYSYLMSKKDVFDSALVNVEVEEEFENENIRKNTLSFVGGFDVNINRIVIGARVGWDLLHNQGDGTTTTPRYKNVWYQASVGILF
jgi:hypothetical protein